MSDIIVKSDQIFYNNLRWILYSGIRIKKGPDTGAIYGWKDLNPPSYPFIYSEATGYAITLLSWVYAELMEPAALDAAKESSQWIIKNMHNNLLTAGRVEKDKFDKKRDLSNRLYSFDNGMIITGLLNLYKLTADRNLLIAAENMATVLIDRFFDGLKLIAVVDRSYKHVIDNEGGRSIKWSTISGAYHSKLSLCLLDLSRLTNNPYYGQVSNSICDYAKTLQAPNGRFITNPDLDFTYLHPHLYACEGLVYAGLKQSSEKYTMAGLKGIIWAIEQINLTSGGLPNDTSQNAVEQSDCIAQLLRLMIICRSQLQKYFEGSELDYIIDRLHLRLLDFYIADGKDKGAMRYQLALESACSWCTMFSMQAFRFWNKTRNLQKAISMEYYV
jgi:hypothetical protein